MLATESCICLVGLMSIMSLYGFRSCMDILRLLILRGGGYEFVVFGLGVFEVIGICLCVFLFHYCLMVLCYE
jgi:hypothetical protein